MFILREKHNKLNPYTMVSNKLIVDKQLSNGAYRILTGLLSNADHFRIYPAQVAKANGLSRRTVEIIFKELINNKYMAALPMPAIKGRFAAKVYVVFERKMSQEETDAYLEDLKNNPKFLTESPCAKTSHGKHNLKNTKKSEKHPCTKTSHGKHFLNETVEMGATTSSANYFGLSDGFDSPAYLSADPCTKTSHGKDILKVNENGVFLPCTKTSHGKHFLNLDEKSIANMPIEMAAFEPKTPIKHRVQETSHGKHNLKIDPKPIVHNSSDTPLIPPEKTQNFAWYEIFENERNPLESQQVKYETSYEIFDTLNYMYNNTKREAANIYTNNSFKITKDAKQIYKLYFTSPLAQKPANREEQLASLQIINEMLAKHKVGELEQIINYVVESDFWRKKCVDLSQLARLASRIHKDVVEKVPANYGSKAKVPDDEIAKRKAYAKTCEYSCQGGYARCEDDGFVVVSGVRWIVVKWDDPRQDWRTYIKNPLQYSRDL